MKKIIYSPGEPAGIGPDIIINLSQTKDWMSYKVPILTIGDKKLFEQRAKVLKKKMIIDHKASIIFILSFSGKAFTSRVKSKI